MVEHARRSRVVTTAQSRIRSYDLETGKVVWESEGLTMGPIPSPVAWDGIVFAMERISGQSLKGDPPGDAKGDVAGGTPSCGPWIATLGACLRLYCSEGLLCVLKSTRESFVFDAEPGRPHYQLQRLPEIPRCVGPRWPRRSRLHDRARRDDACHPAWFII